MPYDPEIEKAVALAKSDEPQPLKKHEQYERLKLFANRQRLPTESEQQSFTRFITKTPEGQILYKSFVATKGASVATGQNGGAVGDPKRQTGQSGSDVDGDDDGSSEGLKKLRAIAAGLRAKDPKLSPQQATAMAMRTPDGVRAAMEDRQHRVGKLTKLQVVLG